jgi:hypothetical protein
MALRSHHKIGARLTGTGDRPVILTRQRFFWIDGAHFSIEVQRTKLAKTSWVIVVFDEDKRAAILFMNPVELCPSHLHCQAMTPCSNTHIREEGG